MNKSVIPYDPVWKQSFANEASALRAVLGEHVQSIHHIGSTSIPGMRAKPIIDILLEVTSLAGLDDRAEAMRETGYEVMGAYGIDGRRYYRKIDQTGTRTHHMHAFTIGSEHVERHLAFRDYLIAHPARAQDYSDLKARLVQGDEVSWDTYLDGKDPFIKMVEQEALKWVRSRT
ncbi:MAG: GrpB family protein [Stappiaceae bacterium]